MKLITDDAAAGIRKRYEHASALYMHKDESVAQGREFVEAYVEYTQYVERLHQDAAGKGAHDEHGEHGRHKKEPGHSKHERWRRRQLKIDTAAICQAGVHL